MPRFIAREVARKLGYYVYLYTDPRTGRPFYVGKGRGALILSHLSDETESRKTAILAELDRLGLEPVLEVLAHGLKDEETAFRIEAAAIDLLGLGTLANRVRGWRSVEVGRMSLDQLVAYYAAKPATVSDPVILIRINKLYRHGMPALDLYEATRGVWRVGVRRNGARYALAVFEGVVREVYEIGHWSPGGSTPYVTRNRASVVAPERWEFTGTVAPHEVRDRYRLHSVELYLARASQYPIAYVNC